jgi:hypothetical protein
MAIVQGGTTVFSRHLGTFLPPDSIFVIDAGGPKPRRIVDGGTPAWSQDGEKLAYAGRALTSVLKTEGCFLVGVKPWQTK